MEEAQNEAEHMRGIVAAMFFLIEQWEKNPPVDKMFAAINTGSKEMFDLSPDAIMGFSAALRQMLETTKFAQLVLDMRTAVHAMPVLLSRIAELEKQLGVEQSLALNESKETAVL